MFYKFDMMPTTLSVDIFSFFFDGADIIAIATDGSACMH